MTRVSPKARRRFTRDGFLFLFGFIGMVHEAWFAKEPREVLVFFFGGLMLGVPFLRMGDSEHDKRGGDKEPPPR